MTDHKAEWVLVPREPTEAMQVAGAYACYGDDVASQTDLDTIRNGYRAMIAAAPAASEGEDGAVATLRNALSYVGYRTAYDLARHYRDEVVPLRKTIADENLLRYNGMLIGVFELLADARAQVAGVNAALEATRDFWLAQADLDQALVGKPGALSALGASATASTAPAARTA